MRRAATVGGVVVLVATLVVAAVLGPGWWSSPDGGATSTEGGAAAPVGTPDWPLVAATPQGMAAAVRTLVPGELLFVRDRSDGVSGHDGPELRVDLTYRIRGRRVVLAVGATQRLSEWRGVRRVCAESTPPDTCELTRVTDGHAQGRPLALLHVAGDAEGPGFDMVVVHRGDAIVFATESVGRDHAGRLPVPLATLRSVVLDPRVGPRTTRALNREGALLAFRP